eukprot:Partr_v1_DN11446_c0_g1_i1_m44889 putative TAM41, mitochondrial translocator assembly and maintenance protein, homolog (S. cerevisiae)
MPQHKATVDETSLVDFIFGVSHPQHWHSLNIRQHPSHYSTCMRHLPTRTIQHVQEKWGAKVYYNTDCMVEGRRIKYGVVAIDDLLDDLEDWTTLYCAGRLQKPVVTVHADDKIQAAQRRNLKSALATALLLLPERVSEDELYSTIASLSYTGDFRMGCMLISFDGAALTPNY